MFPPSPLPYAPLTSDQQTHWEAFLDKLRLFAAEQATSDDPYVFHGTSLLRSEWILREGFHGSGKDYGHGLVGQAFWTSHVDTAVGFAEGRVGMARNFSRVDDLPAVLTAKLSDVISAGTPMPDNNYAHSTEDECETWQESLREVGVMKIVRFDTLESIRVPNMTVLGPKWRSLLIHPQAATDREARLLDPSMLQPPPGMEWTGNGPAETWDAIELAEFGIRESSGRIVFNEEAWYERLMPKQKNDGSSDAVFGNGAALVR